MPTSENTRLTLLEFQAKQTQEAFFTLSTDVREMKDALLTNLAEGRAQSAIHSQVSTELKTLKADCDAQKAFMWKIAGVLSTIQVIGLPGVVYLLLHLSNFK